MTKTSHSGRTGIGLAPLKTMPDQDPAAHAGGAGDQERVEPPAQPGRLGLDHAGQALDAGEAGAGTPTTTPIEPTTASPWR